MNAVEFIKERDRMLKVAGQAPSLSYRHEKSAEEIVREVERWSAAHPRKTRQSVFLEQWPNAIVEYGTLTICPKVVLGRKGWAEDGCGGILCNNCRRDFWMQEVE